MMNFSKYFWKLVALIIGLITFAVVGTLLLIFSSCKMTKDVQKSTETVAKVNKVDSGSVKKEESKSKFENEWWRDIFIPQPPIKETTKEVLQPIYNNTTQPIIIRESGRQSLENNNLKYDSGYYKGLDSLKAEVKKSSKQTEVKVLSIWQMIGLGIGGGLFVLIVSKITSKFKIVRA